MTYRIVVSIVRGTAAGRALALMANGLQVESESYGGILERHDHYLDCAAPILAATNDGVVFGTIAILNMTNGTIEDIRVLKGEARVVRAEAGAAGALAKGGA